jgi:beta-lactamase class A
VEDNVAFRAGIINTTTAPDLGRPARRGGGRARGVARGDGVDARAAGAGVRRGDPGGRAAGTPVAHKTGSIRGVLHDAAIVYPPGRAPYVLVVLTRGVPDEAAARAAIVDVSRAVWGAVARE